MTYNVTGYLVFLSSMVLIIIYVGNYFYKNGRIFILTLMNGNVSLTDSINRLLLTGYYLLNIGYAFLQLRRWEVIDSIEELLSSVATNVGVIVVVLAVIHYINMAVIYYFSKKTFHHQ